MVGGDYVNLTVCGGLPERVRVRRLAYRRGADEFCALEAGTGVYLVGQREVLRAGLDQHPLTSITRRLDGGQSLVGGQVDDPAGSVSLGG